LVKRRPTGPNEHAGEGNHRLAHRLALPAAIVLGVVAIYFLAWLQHG
jgi:hypothetical protein